jgi:hypothetical protein
MNEAEQNAEIVQWAYAPYNPSDMKTLTNTYCCIVLELKERPNY